MTVEEARTWIGSVLAVLTWGIYLVIVLSRAQDVPLASVSYTGPMLWTLGLGILAAIILSIVLGIVFPREKRDQRDREIYRFGEYVGHSFVVIGAVSALLMALAEWDHFWIANAIYLGFFLSAIVGGAAKLIAYRWGFQW
jgi:hypothetical protein